MDLYKKKRLDAERWGVEDRECAQAIAEVEKERSEYEAQLIKTSYTPEYLADVKATCARIYPGFAAFRSDEKRQTYELLNLRLRLAVEDDFKVTYRAS